MCSGIVSGLGERSKLFFGQSALEKENAVHVAMGCVVVVNGGDELKNLLSDKLNEKPSLLLGISRFNQVLRVTSTEKRRELGNVLITAPTRGGSP